MTNIPATSSGKDDIVINRNDIVTGDDCMKVGIAMSGGVDSAVAASRLKEAGHDVVAYHMINLPGTGDSKNFGSSEAEAAAETAAFLGIKLRLVDLRKEFRAKIIDYFIGEYAGCRTPNPCVVCNDEIKFGLLMERAMADGAEKFATGHYARIVEDEVYGTVIARGTSYEKDQAYFLSRIARNKLGYLCFPNGNSTKDDIRREAQKIGLKVHSKRDSQEICFVRDDDYGRFLTDEKLSFREGDVIDVHGNILGRHRGLAFYTIGQRRGLGISSSERLYVVGMDCENSKLILGPKDYAMRNVLTASRLNWQARIASEKIPCTCKIRSSMSPVQAVVEPAGSGVTVRFEKPVFAVMPGQLAVFFHDDLVLGSAFLES